jgi:hypothetical protein
VEHYRDWEIVLTEQHDAAMPWKAVVHRLDNTLEMIESEGVNRDCALAMAVVKIDRKRAIQ